MEKLAMEFFKDKMEDLLPLKLNWHLEQCLIGAGVIELVGDDFLCERIDIVSGTYCEISKNYDFGRGRSDFEISAFEIELCLKEKFLEHLELIKKNIILNLRAFFSKYKFFIEDEKIKFTLK